MPRRKKLDERGPEWEEEKAQEEEIDQEDQEMESIARSLPGGVRCISLYRQHSGGLGGRPKFIAQLPPENFSEAFIQEAYGGGSYFGRWQKKDGGMLRYGFDIEGPPRIQQEQREDSRPEIIQAYPDELEGRNGDLSTTDVLRLISETRREAREEMRMMLEMMRPPVQSTDATAQVFGLVEKIVPLISQGGDGGNPWLMALAHFKEPLTKLVDTINVAVTRPVATSMPQPAAVHRTVQSAQVAMAPKPNQAVTEEPDMIVYFIKQYLPLLVSAAAKNLDPANYAELVLDQLPESSYNQLKAWLEKPDCLEKIASIEPGVRFQQEWWVALRSSLIEVLNAPVSVQSGNAPSESVEG